MHKQSVVHGMREVVTGGRTAGGKRRARSASTAARSKSSASRRFVALSAARMKDWMASDLSDLDLLVIQIDGIHMDEDLILVAAIGVDAKGDKHPLGLAEGATEN